jgi:Transposase DDE domain
MTSEVGHGRIELRRLSASSALQGYLNWPGAQQVFRIERRRTQCRTGKVEEEVVYGVASLRSERADAAALLRLVRQHWHIENRSHWVRDVTFDEDRSQVRTGSIPEVMAALRNLTIGILRSTGATNIAAAGRYHAAHPAGALALIGVEVKIK